MGDILIALGICAVLVLMYACVRAGAIQDQQIKRCMEEMEKQQQSKQTK